MTPQFLYSYAVGERCPKTELYRSTSGRENTRIENPLGQPADCVHLPVAP